MGLFFYFQTQKVPFFIVELSLDKLNIRTCDFTYSVYIWSLVEACIGCLQYTRVHWIHKNVILYSNTHLVFRYPSVFKYSPCIQIFICIQILTLYSDIHLNSLKRHTFLGACLWTINDDHSDDTHLEPVSSLHDTSETPHI